MDNATQYSSFIVKYRDGTRKRASIATAKSELSSRLGAQAKRSLGNPAIQLAHQRRLGIHADVVRSTQPLDRVQAQALIRLIAQDPDVEYVQPNYLKHAYAEPNDSRYSEQWHYSDPTAGAAVPVAWDRSTGEGVVVAVVDSGYLPHSDLTANLLPGYDMVSSTSASLGGSNDGDGRDADATDASNVVHGTHVAGTVAAVTNNNSGVAGIAYNARVVPVRVLGNDGSGTSDDVIDGILWAAGVAVDGTSANANPAEVINLSLGGQGACSPAEQDAIDAATAQGAIVVIAAGNDNTDVANASPANCNNVIAVAANDIHGNRAFYSNYGSGITITAPGGETWSCRADVGEFLPLDTQPTAANCAPTQSHPSQGVLSTVADDGYDFYSGTSMAAPHVAGIVALIQAAAATPKTTDQIKTILADTAHPIATTQCPGGCGPGIIDAAAAVQKAIE